MSMRTARRRSSATQVLRRRRWRPRRAPSWYCEGRERAAADRAEGTTRVPLSRGPDAARRAGFVVVDDLGDADFAIARISTPFDRLHPNYFFGARYNEGSLAYADGNKRR